MNESSAEELLRLALEIDPKAESVAVQAVASYAQHNSITVKNALILMVKHLASESSYYRQRCAHLTEREIFRSLEAHTD